VDAEEIATISSARKDNSSEEDENGDKDEREEWLKRNPKVNNKAR
jgi:hypothetical protein